MSTNSFGSDNQITQKKSSNLMNAGYLLYSLTGREVGGMDNIPSIELMNTIKQIPLVESNNLIVIENSNSPIQNLVKMQ